MPIPNDADAHVRLWQAVMANRAKFPELFAFVRAFPGAVVTKEYVVE